MKLTYKEDYLSIREFLPVELPDFTILTGVNGSGKSHLLRGIQEGVIGVDDLSGRSIARFTYETFQLRSEGIFSHHEIISERESAWSHFESDVRRVATQWKKTLGPKYAELRARCAVENRSLWGLEGIAEIDEFRKHVDHYFRQGNRRNEPRDQALYTLIKTLSFSIDEITREEFAERFRPYSYHDDFLPAQVGKVIWDYYGRFRNNEVNRHACEVHGKSYTYVSEEDFIAKHGDKPWVVLNEMLASFETLDYEIPSPEGTEANERYQLKLKHRKLPDIEISLGDLSSGEKVLMALVASIYKTASDQHFPRLLLLDEVDASLHPSMIKSLFMVIDNIFLSRGMKVMLVTHSPTTIALAPDDAVFVMNKYGLDRIEKKTKQEALSILTEGFATLDEGIRLFDQISTKSLSIITEGRNAQIIQRALEHFEISDVDVLTGAEGSSGKNQLKTLFDFFTKVPHRSPVLFVLDCDVKSPFTECNGTFALVLDRNETNLLAKDGIENMFPTHMFSDFTSVTMDSKGNTIQQFDRSRKGDFTDFIVSNGI